MRYKVVFENYYYSKKDKRRVTRFHCDTKADLELLISSLSAFYSGDDISCKINGKVAPLFLDYGLEEGWDKTIKASK